MKRLVIFFFILIHLNCSKNPEPYIQYLDGYWEIEKVILASGEEHNYSYNEFIDYFKLTDSLTGFRKKLKPALNNTFEASDDVEFFKLKIEHDSLNIYYHTNFSNWKETILLASKTELKIINEEKNIYIYKPYKPLNLD
ncbi:MAG: hypothetical protein GW839_07960 [Flavobacteriales bacterium]|nr:hypothetical protein [Flavobacteriia bacterium]NCP06581.1 hypothetical protein [Flavobacteriales bacterium]PIV94730.1 MAG: hypothetical protein COW44_02675 [Flavobacteriaceae bacterium CG17_big_fil_post_rev_8_21_14_2_50_33_15]PIY13500.1 MAG: hypothetical protein COZ17_00210 [Flavobacteriaceae bacterium CG_4_10_14_3_um_filter_33_47]PJB16909.1 MAG: hypothetical protein CO117_13635 [Flavobacteriaceae bacterium CG_4_9_14_3_um_filter_33_16]